MVPSSPQVAPRGAFGADIISPSNYISTARGWEETRPMAGGLYRLPPGYTIAGGTSTATPTAAGAVALLIPKATLFGVGVLVCTMIGAALTHMFVIGVGPQTVVIAFLVVMLLIVGASTPIGGGRGRNT